MGIIEQHIKELEELSKEKIIVSKVKIRSKSYIFKYEENNNRIVGWAMFQTKENIYLVLNNKNN
jgi:hypothetical protein